jgi:hypothetical protein
VATASRGVPQNFACVTQHFLDRLLVGFALPIIGRQHTSIAVDFGTENVKISRRVRDRLCPYCKLECLNGALLFDTGSLVLLIISRSRRDSARSSFAEIAAGVPLVRKTHKC